jgi:hypothetical protein
MSDSTDEILKTARAVLQRVAGDVAALEFDRVLAEKARQAELSTKCTRLPDLPHHFAQPDLVIHLNSLGDARIYRPCETCRKSNVVPHVDGDNGFPHCCPQQGQSGQFRCMACGEMVSKLGACSIEGREQPWHVGRHQELCGPLVPDPANPPFIQLFGKESRR